MPPKVSVIIGNYNYGQFVDKAIESALSQDDQDVEVIVIDDGSTDQSKEVIQRYGNSVIPIFKDNNGQGSVFNKGFAASSGDPVVMLDADDLLQPQAASRVAACAEQDPTWSKLTWQMQTIGPSGEKRGTLEPAHPPASGDLLPRLLESGPLSYSCAPCSGNAWRRGFLDLVLPLPEEDFRRGADAYLLLTSPFYGLSRVIDESLSCYRVHGTNFLASKSEFEKMNTLRARYKAYLRVLDWVFRERGIEYDPSGWGHQHWDMLERFRDEVCKIVPENELMVLVDDDILNVGSAFFGRPRRHVIEMDGAYYGPPNSSEHAIQHLQDIRSEGVQYLVFCWYNFWWLEHYHELFKWLCNEALLISDTAECKIYRWC
jgi:glycosyltransferase involved in cell wall biosynthesis